MDGPLDGNGTTTVFCLQCETKKSMYGYMPFAREIWRRDEGLECCGRQTVIINQESSE